jgi:hypothetical protein
MATANSWIAIITPDIISMVMQVEAVRAKELCKPFRSISWTKAENARNRMAS